jgi:hypothetical protein
MAPRRTVCFTQPHLHARNRDSSSMV